MFVEYNERMKQNCIENEEKREVDQMTDAYIKVGNTSKIAMEATVSLERADRSRCYCGIDPNDCYRFCNKLVQNTTRGASQGAPTFG
jgi:hypothetical protein